MCKSLDALHVKVNEFYFTKLVQKYRNLIKIFPAEKLQMCKMKAEIFNESQSSNFSAFKLMLFFLSTRI